MRYTTEDLLSYLDGWAWAMRLKAPVGDRFPAVRLRVEAHDALVEALEFYALADEEHWATGMDGGERARAALPSPTDAIVRPIVTAETPETAEGAE